MSCTNEPAQPARPEPELIIIHDDAPDQFSATELDYLCDPTNIDQVLDFEEDEEHGASYLVKYHSQQDEFWLHRGMLPKDAGKAAWNSIRGRYNYRKRQERKEAEVPEASDDLPEAFLCGLCSVRKKDTVFQPCKHLYLCYFCYRKILKHASRKSGNELEARKPHEKVRRPTCPLCRREITRADRVDLQ